MNKIFLRAKLNEGDALTFFVKYEHVNDFSHYLSLNTNLEPYDIVEERRISVNISDEKLFFINKSNNHKEIFRREKVDCSDFFEAILEQIDENDNIEILGRYCTLLGGSNIIHLKILNTSEDGDILKNTEYIVRYDINLDMSNDMYLYSNKELEEKKN